MSSSDAKLRPVVKRAGSIIDDDNNGKDKPLRIRNQCCRCLDGILLIADVSILLLLVGWIVVYNGRVEDEACHTTIFGYDVGPYSASTFILGCFMDYMLVNTGVCVLQFRLRPIILSVVIVFMALSVLQAWCTCFFIKEIDEVFPHRPHQAFVARINRNLFTSPGS